MYNAIILIVVAIFLIALYVKNVVPFLQERSYIKMEIERSFSESEAAYWKKELKKLVRQECEKAGIQWRTEELFAYMHRFEDRQAGEQLTLFDISGKNS